MIRLVVHDFSQAEWSARTDGNPELSLLQTWAYGEAKARSSRWRVTRAAILDGDREIGAVQALVRTIPLLGGGLVWVNRGPLLDDRERRDPRARLDTLEALRRFWVVDRRMVLRIALPWRDASDPRSPDAESPAPPGFRVADAGRGFRSSRVDLEPPIDVLRKGLEHKWRNCLSKAERLALDVESSVDGRLFSAAIEEYEAMLARKGFETSVTPELLHPLQEISAAGRKLWALVARSGTEVLGVVLIARYGDTAEYLLGSSNPSGRKSNAGHLLIWRAMSDMKAQGCRWFDLGGLDPERTPAGICHFKEGVRGTPYALPDEIEAFRDGIVSHAVRYAVGRARRHT